MWVDKMKKLFLLSLSVLLLPTIVATCLSEATSHVAIEDNYTFATALLIRSKIDVGPFAPIPAGEFMMGSAKGGLLGDQKPLHKVRISKSFEMGKHEVTQEQWQSVIGNNPSYFKGENLPVETVSWDDVQKFIEKLKAQNDGYTYRLPTEAEWEYACRAGRTGDYKESLDEMAWYEMNSASKTHPVGQKKPNSWGLYDMQGNVSEWCQDWYAENYYSHSPPVDPKGPKTTQGLPVEMRAVRGCSRINRAAACQPSFRLRLNPDGTSEDVGFRLVRTKP
jgi:formylglycine-generating enzyme required for sulfatase activity